MAKILESLQILQEQKTAKTSVRPTKLANSLCMTQDPKAAFQEMEHQFQWQNQEL
jgi:hypothetical protein